MKICFAASSGGHLEELSRLAPLADGREHFLITERVAHTEQNFCDRVYYVRQINRRQLTFLPLFISLFFRCVRILMSERAGCVITTGALMGYPVALAAKVLRKKVIYIESFARVDSASLTGRLIYPIADLFIVQWREGLQFFPKAVYGGGIF